MLFVKLISSPDHLMLSQRVFLFVCELFFIKFNSVCSLLLALSVSPAGCPVVPLARQSLSSSFQRAHGNVCLSLLAFQVLEPFRWASRVPTHDWNETRFRLQKKLLERTLGWRSLYPIKCVARYLCREQNLDPCSSLLDSYIDAPTIKLTEVVNQQKFVYCNRNARKVSVVLLTKCPEPFAGVEYK